MKRLTFLLIIISIMSFSSFVQTSNKQLKQTIYHGGNIISMQGDKPEYVDVMCEVTVLQTIKEGKTVNKKPSCEKLTGYFVKNNFKFDDDFDFKHLVITSQKDFDSYFGVAKTMKNKISTINFEENYVIAILSKPSKNSKTIDVTYCEFDGDKLTVNYGIKYGARNNYKSSGLYLGTIPNNIKTVSFKSKDNTSVVNVK